MRIWRPAGTNQPIVFETDFAEKLENLTDRFEEIAVLLSQPEVQGDQNQFRALSQEYAQIDPIVACYKSYQENQQNLEADIEMTKDPDPELREMAKERIRARKL